ncbi:DUF484 family protein [Marinomonas epiphytica]
MNEKDVVKYLSSHPDFFLKNSELLEGLTLPHPVSGNAISLLEYQVNLLRKSTASYRQEFERLVAVARENEATMKKSRRLVLSGLACDSVEDLAVVIDDMVQNEFNIPFHRFVLFGDFPDLSVRSHFLTEDDLIIPQVSGFTECFCGELPANEIAFLFEKEAEGIASTAVLPLILKRAGETKKLGVLVLASNRAEAFHQDKGALFLEYIADLVCALLSRLLP